MSLQRARCRVTLFKTKHEQALLRRSAVWSSGMILAYGATCPGSISGIAHLFGSKFRNPKTSAALSSRFRSVRKICTNRESNPGPKHGKLGCYHYTIGARGMRIAVTIDLQMRNEVSRISTAKTRRKMIHAWRFQTPACKFSPELGLRTHDR